MATARKGRNIALLLSLGVVALLAAAVWLVGQGYLSFRWHFASLGENEHGFPEYRHRQTGIVFVKLPGGKFIMGAQDDAPEARDQELPEHEVALSPFLISKFEVSRAEWKKIMGNSPSHLKGDQLPVEEVSWNDCQEFCRLTGLSLPSEAEWEFACRAGTSGPYAGELSEMGWWARNSGGKAHPVGQKKSNGFGLHDMHGNVWEWCDDIYDKYFYQYPEASGLDPISTTGSGERVVRGGGVLNLSEDCRSACRGGGYPDGRIPGIGFRPCYRLSN